MGNSKITQENMTKKEEDFSEGEESIVSFDDCAICRLLGSKEGSLERRKLFKEFDKTNGNIKGCSRVMQEISRAWWSGQVKRLISEPKFERRGPPEIAGFKIPAWWECQWRRVPCRSADCVFCGRMLAFERLMENEEKEDDPGMLSNEAMEITEAVGVSESSEKDFESIMKVVRHQAKDLGIPVDWLLGEAEITEDDFDDDGKLIKDLNELPDDMPPEPEKFILYRRAIRWSRPVARYIGRAEESGVSWTKTKAAEDLLWYGSMLPSKVYRQLSTRFEMNQAKEQQNDNDDEGKFFSVELGYTGFVLREIAEIIENSLAMLAVSSDKPSDFEAALKTFRRLKPSILEIAKK